MASDPTTRSPKDQIWYASPLTRTIREDGSCVILELKEGRFLSLNGTGAAIWEAIRSSPAGLSCEGIASDLSARIGSLPDSFPKVSRFIHSLSARGLISDRKPRELNENVLPETRQAEIETLRCRGNTVKTDFGLRGRAYGRLLRCGQVLHRRGFFALRSMVIRSGLAQARPDEIAIDRICVMRRAVEWSLLHYPTRVDCLQQSAALAILLRGDGIHAKVMIGCEFLPFFSHAWVQVDSLVVNDSAAICGTFHLVDVWS